MFLPDICKNCGEPEGEHEVLHGSCPIVEEEDFSFIVKYSETQYFEKRIKKTRYEIINKG